MPWMTAIGNHERDWPDSGSNVGWGDSGGECGVPYRHYFPMPPPVPREESPSSAPTAASPRRATSDGLLDTPWYSFEEGLVHVAVLSSEHEAQVEWLERDLCMVRRHITPWVIVALHRPMYLTGIDGNPLRNGSGYDYMVAGRLRDAYEEVLLKHGVDLVLAGHHHSYQRTCHIFNNSCAASWPSAEPGASRRGAERSRSRSRGHDPLRSSDAASATGQPPVHLVVGMAGFENSPILEPMSRKFVYADSRHHGFARLSASRHALTVEYLVPRVPGQRWPHSIFGVDVDCDCAILDAFTLQAKT